MAMFLVKAVIVLGGIWLLDRLTDSERWKRFVDRICGDQHERRR